jgi:hypothetical protein
MPFEQISGFVEKKKQNKYITIFHSFSLSDVSKEGPYGTSSVGHICNWLLCSVKAKLELTSID